MLDYFKQQNRSAVKVAAQCSGGTLSTVLYDQTNHVFGRLEPQVNSELMAWSWITFKTATAFQQHNFKQFTPTKQIGIQKMLQQEKPAYLGNINQNVICTINAEEVYRVLNIKFKQLQYKWMRIGDDATQLEFDDFEYFSGYAHIKGSTIQTRNIPSSYWYSCEAVYALIYLASLDCEVALVDHAIRITCNRHDNPFEAYVLAQVMGDI